MGYPGIPMETLKIRCFLVVFFFSIPFLHLANLWWSLTPPTPFKFGGFFECNSIAPENQCLEDEISFWGQNAYFQVRIGC